MADNNIPSSLLHGVYNLTDLLGELPLAEPASESLIHQQIAFDSRLTEDMRRILQNDGRTDMNLLARLCQGLSQIDSSQISLTSPSSESLPSEQSQPLLLKAILASNPNVFRGPQNQAPFTSPQRRPSGAQVPQQGTSHVQNQNQQPSSMEKLLYMDPVVKVEQLKSPHDASTSKKSTLSESVKKQEPRSATIDNEDEATVVKVKKKKKKELDQLQQDNRNLAKYDARYPNQRQYPTSLAEEAYDDELIAGLLGKTQNDVERKRAKKDFSTHAQRDSASLNVMAEQGLPELRQYEDSTSNSVDNGDNPPSSPEWKEAAGSSQPHHAHKVPSASKIKKRKRDKDENDRLTVRLQLSLIGGNDDLIENVVYRNFVNAMENVFRNVDDANLHDYFKNQDADNLEVPNEALISRGLLTELVSESSKLCELGATSHIAPENLSRILQVLQWNVKYGGSCVLTRKEDLEKEDAGDNWEREMQLFREVSAQRIIHSIDACLGILYVLTAPNLPRQLYTDEVIEAVIVCVRYQMHHVIFPEFDPLYRADSEGKSYSNMKSKRSRSGHVKDKLVMNMYQKIMLTCDLLANLVAMQDLGDELLIKLTSIAVSPFFVENISELQLASLRLVVSMFAKHERIRQYMLEDILTNLTKLPSTKRNLRSYRLWNHNGSIQMVTALVLNIVQCMAKLPEAKQPEVENSQATSSESKTDSNDASQMLQTSFDLSRKIALLFITAFFKKCTTKSEDDYRPLFENFVQDLLTTAQRPEWPATDMMLTLLGSVLVKHFTDRNADNNIRTAALDYFGQIAARLRRDSISAALGKDMVDAIVEQLKDMDQDYATIMETVELDENTRLTQAMQKAFSTYLLDASQLDPTLAYAKNFCLTQWHADAITDADRALKIYQNNTKQGIENFTTEQEIQDRCDVQKRFVNDLIASQHLAQQKSAKMPVVSHETACAIAIWLGKQRQFAQSFDFFLTNILNLLAEPTIAIRTRAMKSLALVVESDPAVLNIVIVRKAVHGCLSDPSTSVREAVVDLIGRFILHNSDLTLNYYPLLCERINDVGVSVRKRVLKIFRDICLEQPDFPKIADLCKQMITRIGDEESIKKLVSEAFQHMWFQPIDTIKDPHRLIRRVTSIVDVVSACREIGYEWFHQLLETLLRKSDESVMMTTMETSKQIVDGLMENTVRCEEVDAESRQTTSSSSTLVSTLTALSIFCKAAPHLLVPHVQLLHPYLNIKCSTQGDYFVIINTCKVLELAVPLMSNPDPLFVKQLETDLLAIASKQGMLVLENVIACLGAVVNKVTQRHAVVISCLEKLTHGLNNFLQSHQKNPQAEVPRPMKASLLRNLYLIGLLCKNFDFESLSQNPGIRDTIMKYYIYFCHIGDEEIKHKSLMGLGFFCTRYFNCLLDDKMKDLYQSFLSPRANSKFKIQVLQNVLAGLKEQEANPLDENAHQFADAAENAVEHNHPDDLKEMFDVQAGMAAQVTQLYLGNILDSYFDFNVDVRTAAADVILLIVAHGLIHPAKCVPYLIAATTDATQNIRNRSEQRLKDIEKRYPNFISMKAIPGARKSFELQRIIQRETGEPIRGLFASMKDDPSANQDQSPATLAALYCLLRANKQHRRVFFNSIIKLFDESSGASLSELVYLADNIVYAPFGTLDEVLQTIFQIEQHVSIQGTNLTQAIKDLCSGNFSNPQSGYIGPDGQFYQNPGEQRIIPEDEEEFFQAHCLMELLPGDLRQVHALVTTTAQNCLLLLAVKNALKEEYALTDAKVRQYVATCNNKAAQKLYDKPPPRRAIIRYAPSQLDNVRSGPPPCPQMGDLRGRQALVSELVQFKQLLDCLDQDAVSAAVNDSFEGEDGLEGAFESSDVELDEDGNPIEKPAKSKKTGANQKTPSKRGRGRPAGSGQRGRPKKAGGGSSNKKKPKNNVNDDDFIDDTDEWGDFAAELDAFGDDDDDYRP